jgi:hypothetical protein
VSPPLQTDAEVETVIAAIRRCAACTYAREPEPYAPHEEFRSERSEQEGGSSPRARRQERLPARPAHSSLARTGRLLGFASHQLRVLPSDERFRMRPDALEAATRPTRGPGSSRCSFPRPRAPSTPAPSIRFPSSPMSAAGGASGCRSTPPTGGLLPP